MQEMTNFECRLFRALAVLLLMALALLPTPTLARDTIFPADQHIVSHPIQMATENTTVVSAVGEPVPRIQCPAGYTATIYAEGLSAPDGLALSPSGVLHVAEETAGRVSRIDSNGSVTPIITGLTNPEGIAFDNTGNLYVVEDVQGGRLVKRATDGITTTLATDLDAPEGVIWTSDGTIYVTESNVQFALNPSHLSHGEGLPYYKTSVAETH
jgi:sugar lactone lactonase YvrE